MKEKSCFKDFMKYSSLNVLGMLGLSCYILADTFFVSKALGSNGLTALNLAIPIYSFINGSGLMIGMGASTKYSIFKSQGNKEKANETFTNATILTAFIASIFLLIGIFGSGFLIELLGADNTVFEIGKTYLQVILLFAPMFMNNNLLLCFIRNDGAPQLSMAAMIGGSLSNIILDYVFMFPLGMGIFGAAFATGLAPVISILILLPFLLKKNNQFHLKKCRLSRKLSLEIFSSGLPSLITEVSSGIVIIIFNTIILNISGNIGVAAYGVIANLSLVVIAIYTGIAQGIQPILSSNYGAKNKKNISDTLKYAMTTVFIISVCIYLCIFFGAEIIVQIFNNEQNEILQNIAVTGLKIYFLACVFAGFNIVISVYFTSISYPTPAHIISILRGFILIIPIAFILSNLGGIIGVWLVFPSTELIVALIGIVLFFKIKNNFAI